MTLTIMLIQCLLFIGYVTGVVYWYNNITMDVSVDRIYTDQDSNVSCNKQILVLIVALLWPVLVCYNAIKDLGLKGNSK